MKRLVTFAVSAMAVAALGVILTPDANAALSCGNGILKGNYSATISGTVAGLPFVELDLVNSTGNGTFSGTGTISYNGSVSTVSFTATYSINSNCSGSAVLSTGVTQNLNIKTDGSEVWFIGTNDPTAEVTGDAKRLSGSGQ